MSLMRYSIKLQPTSVSIYKIGNLLACANTKRKEKE